MKLNVQATKVDKNSGFGSCFERAAKFADTNLFPDVETVLPRTHAEERYKKMRAYIDGEMMNYLIEHDGVIDGWPDPNTKFSRTFVWDDGYNETYFFHYFGIEYGYGFFKSYRRDNTIEYHNEYQYKYSNEYEKNKRKGEYRGVSLFDNRIQQAKQLVCKLPMIIAVISIIMNVIGIFGVDLIGLMETILSVNEVTGTLYFGGVADKIIAAVCTILLAVPFVPSLFVVTMAEAFGDLAIVIGSIITGFAGWLATFFLLRYYKPHPISTKKIKREMNVAKAYQKSEEYQRTVLREDALKAEYEAISEEWHRAWFEFYKTNYAGRYYSGEKMTRELMNTLVKEDYARKKELEENERK